MTKKWDLRFLRLAREASTWSKDPSTKVGAVLAGYDKMVISVGYNGFAQDMKDDEALYLNREEKLSRIIHAEMNALLFAGEKARESLCYVYPFPPCDRCTAHLIQAGVWKFISLLPTEAQLERWGDSFVRSQRYIDECGGKLIMYKEEELDA